MKSDRAPLASLRTVVEPPSAPVGLDDTDLRLLRLLAADSRLSQRALARELHMSAPAVADRIARLERTGVLRGYTVEIDWAAAGWPVTVYLAITAVQGSDLGLVLAGLTELPEVSDVIVVTGSIDLLARLVARDHGHLRQLLLDRIWQIEGVQRTETFLVLADLRQDRFADQLIASVQLDPAPQNHPPQEGNVS